MTTKIEEYFGEIEDPRADNKRHKLIDIIFMTICAVLCGIEDWDEIAFYCQKREKWFSNFLELPHGVPSKDTFRRVIQRIRPEEFQKCFLKWVEAVRVMTKGEIVAIDGKRVKRSYNKVEGKAAIHLISAWASENKLVLAQIKTEEKSNEITAIPELLRMIAIEGCIVTIDAMGTQKEITKEIVGHNADYVLALKGNQGTLHDEVVEFFDKEVINKSDKLLEQDLAKHGCIMDHLRTIDKGHGRIEIRDYYITDYVSWLSQKDDWTKLQAIGMVKSERIIGDEKSIEYRHFIASIGPDAKEFEGAVRGHWGVENKVHWVLDVTYNEDGSRIRKDYGAENMALLRRLTMNLLRKDDTKYMSLKKKRLNCMIDEEYLKYILFE